MPKATSTAWRRRLALHAGEERGLFGVGGRKAALDEVHAELVELERDAHLLVDRDRQALLLHAVAQGGVVERDDAPPCGACSLAAQAQASDGLVDVLEVVVELGAVARRDLVEDALDLARDGTRLADRVVVDLADGHDLGGGAGEEDLVGEDQVGAREVALVDLVAERRRRCVMTVSRVMPSSTPSRAAA